MFGLFCSKLRERWELRRMTRDLLRHTAPVRKRDIYRPGEAMGIRSIRPLTPWR